MSVEDLVSKWNVISLTESEEKILSALRFIEPDIERIVSIAPGEFYHRYLTRGGFKVKTKNSPTPFPIGSLGDGIWRMLAMAISLDSAKNGILLIDEIDTGLHYSVMADMWNLIYRTAQESNIQVFATTHSYDCVRSLATICKNDDIDNNNVSIQRIEMDMNETIPYTESEILEAARNHIEVR